MVPLADLADSWSSIYSGSPVIKSAVAFAHIGALLAGGGMAIAADRATLAAHKFGAQWFGDGAHPQPRKALLGRCSNESNSI